jgi:orotate phosphoribosyltransferase
MDDFKKQLYSKMSNIIKKRHYVLKSGEHSNTYINKTEITLDPSLYLFIIKNLTQAVTGLFGKTTYDIITGPAVAGIAFAAPVALNIGKAFIFPEKKNDEMVFRNEYKEIMNNKRVIIIEDIVTTGASIAKTASAIRNSGGVPKAAICIWNRSSNCDLRAIKYHYNYSSQYKTTSASNDTILTQGFIQLFSLLTKEVESWSAEKCTECRPVG